MNRTFGWSFALAVMLHLILVGVSVNFFMPQKLVGTNDEVKIPAYLHDGSFSVRSWATARDKKGAVMKVARVATLHLRPKKEALLRGDKGVVAAEHMVTPQDHLLPPKLRQRQTAAASVTAPSPEFLVLLHDLIQERIEYPHDVLPLLGERRVYVGFDLFPDGHVANVKILQSSSSDVLDQAAINALTSLSPIAIAQQFLKERQALKIYIRFVA